jgi:hypothetical protein
MNMFLIIIGGMFGFFLLIGFGEQITLAKPNTKFAKFWRKHIVIECQECD